MRVHTHHQVWRHKPEHVGWIDANRIYKLGLDTGSWTPKMQSWRF